MNSLRVGRLLLVLCCAFAALAHAAPPARWTMIDLGDLAGGAGGSTALAINDRGAIVGDLGQHGSYLHQDGEVTLLESIPEVQAGGWTRLVPTAINNRGWITGWGMRPGQTSRAFVLIPR